MPNRLIKETICTSEKINSLSDFGFRLWTCLVTYVDDYGRGDGRAAIIKGRCFPLLDRITVRDISEGLQELADNGCILLYEVEGEKYLCFPSWDKHQTIRNQKSKYPAPQATENNCEQLKAVASKSPRNPIQSNPNPNPNRSRNTRAREDDDDDNVGGISMEEAQQVQQDHNIVLDAAERAGFPKSESVRDTLIAFYAEHGKQKMLDAIDACVEHSAPSIAYLRAVLRGDPKPQRSARATVPAQQYHQREYDDSQTEQIKRFVQLAEAGMGNAG